MAGLHLLIGCAGPSGLQTVYCYRTLADVSCYEAPDQGREARLVGTYQRAVPSPATAAQPTASPAPPSRPGALQRWFFASLELAARILAPIGPVLGLFRES